MATSPQHIDVMMQAPAAKAGKAPITASPAFPWIVALWFAALLGIGSLIIPVGVLERVILASGLPGVLPMAAPPLGFTAQSLLALAGTVSGGLLGLTLAKRLARPKQKQISSASTLARKPLNPAEDIGEPDFDTDDDRPALLGRRRLLAIEVDEGPSDFLNIAPVPGGPEGRHETDAAAPAVEPALVEEFEEPGGAEVEAQRQELQPDARLQDEPRQEFQPDTAEAEEQPLDLDPSTELADEEPAAQQLPDGPGFEPDTGRQEFIATGQSSRPVIEVGYSGSAAAGTTAPEPLPFSPPSMARQDEGSDENDGNIDPAIDFTDEPTFAPGDETGEESEDCVSDKQIFEAPDARENASLQADASEDERRETVLHDDGLVQLVQRLGSTLEKHREWSAERAANKIVMAAKTVEPAEEYDRGEDSEEIAEAPVPDEFDPAAADEAAQAMAAYFGSPAARSGEQQGPVAFTDAPQDNAPTSGQPDFARPASNDGGHPGQRYGALTGIAAAAPGGCDEDEEDDADIVELAASFSLPLANEATPKPAPRPAFDQPPPSPAIPTEEPAETADVASLNPFKRDVEEFVRIDEPEPEEGSAEPAVLFPNQDNHKPAATASRTFDPPVGEGDAAAAQRAERPRPSNDDNERALREALMNLQRMAK